MKTVSVALDSHMQQEVTKLARCWKLVRKDDVEFFFTSFDENLAVDGDTYLAATGFSNTAIQNKSDLSVDNLDVTGVFDDDSIKIADLRAGLFDYADVFIFLVNWSDLSQGILKLRRGKLGECTSSPQGWFSTELRGMSQLLQQSSVELYGPECRVDIFSPKCGLIADDYECHAQIDTFVSGNIWNWIEGPNVVDATPAPYPGGLLHVSGRFKYGTVKFTTGDNIGWIGDVKNWTDGTLELYIQPPYPIQVGDEFDCWPGCAKDVPACKAFQNLLNMRAEPYLPGNDQVFFYPDSK